MIKGYVLGEHWFKTKEEVRGKIREILYSYELNSYTTIEDTDILLGLLQWHPRVADKIGCGIAAFQVRNSPFLAKERCFYLIRTDGSEDDFSYLKCITPPTPKVVFHSICRRAVAFDVSCFKDHVFRDARRDGKIKCPVSGVWVGYDQAHVDHIPPNTFEYLVRTFIQKHQIDVTQVQLRSIDRVAGQVFADDQMTKQWVAFHQEHAHLRVVSAYANLCIIPKLVREGKVDDWDRQTSEVGEAYQGRLFDTFPE